jgi:copper chaperone CopZ
MTSHDLGLTDKNAGCACGHDSHGASIAAESAPNSTEFLVEGMTCSHCVSSVTDELEELPGVLGVSVDLNAGGASKVAVASSGALDQIAVRRAIESAGYSLAPSS